MCLWNIVWFNKQVIRLYRMTYMIEIIRYLCNCGNNAKQLLVIGYSVTLAFYPPPFWTVYVFLHPPVGIGVGVIQTLFAAHCLLRIRLEKIFLPSVCYISQTFPRTIVHYQFDQVVFKYSNSNSQHNNEGICNVNKVSICKTSTDKQTRNDLFLSWFPWR